MAVRQRLYSVTLLLIRCPAQASHEGDNLAVFYVLKRRRWPRPAANGLVRCGTLETQNQLDSA
jgi:hypothetical protein